MNEKINLQAECETVVCFVTLVLEKFESYSAFWLAAFNPRYDSLPRHTY